MREMEEVPRALIVALAVLAALSFTGGSVLELSGDGWLAAHPYWGNLLSGVTGFASSGLAISVIFRRMQTRQQRQIFLQSVRPELERAAAQVIMVAYRVLKWTGASLTAREKAAFESLDDPDGQARAFKIISSAPGTKPLGVAVPALVHAAAATADRFEIVDRMGRMTVRALNEQRAPGTSDYLLAMQASSANDTWFWRTVDISRPQREQIMQDLAEIARTVEATSVLDLPTARGIADALQLAQARAEALASDPDQSQAVSRALTMLSRITVGLPHTAVSAARVTQLLEHCSTVAFRPLQLCADLVVTWSLILDLTQHPRLGGELRAALAMVVPGAGSLLAAPTPVASPASDLDQLTRGYSTGELLARSWYERESDIAD